MAVTFFYSTGNVDLNFSLEKGILDNRYDNEMINN